MLNPYLKIVLQIAIVVTVSSIFSYICSVENYKSAVNGIWAFLFPATIAVWFNDTKKTQMIMLYALMVLSIFIAGLFTVVAGFD